jgi:hypothetical protein
MPFFRARKMNAREENTLQSMSAYKYLAIYAFLDPRNFPNFLCVNKIARDDAFSREYEAMADSRDYDTLGLAVGKYGSLILDQYFVARNYFASEPQEMIGAGMNQQISLIDVIIARRDADSIYTSTRLQWHAFSGACAGAHIDFATTLYQNMRIPFYQRIMGISEEPFMLTLKYGTIEAVNLIATYYKKFDIKYDARTYERAISSLIRTGNHARAMMLLVRGGHSF